MGLATSAVKAFTTKGYRLVSKQTKQAGEILETTVPENAAIAKIAKVETNFGQGSTTITTFYDKDGNLLQRLMNKTKGAEVENVNSVYQGKHDTGMDITREKTVNGKLKQKVVSHHLFGNKQLAREKLTMDFGKKGSRLETQVMERLAPQGHRNFIQTTLKRDVDSIITEKNIESNFAPQKDLQELSQSPYFYFRNYDNEEFIREITPYAKKLQQVEQINPKVVIQKIDPYTSGNSSGYNKAVIIDAGIEMSKGELVNTLNHELRHQYQWHLTEQVPNSLANQYKQLQERMQELQAKIDYNKKLCKEGFLKRTLRNIGFIKDKPAPAAPAKTAPTKALTPYEKVLAKKFADNFKSYIKAENDFDGYYNQILEVDARKAGLAAQLEFNKDTIKLNELFLNARGNLHNWSARQKEAYNELQTRISNLFDMFS